MRAVLFHNVVAEPVDEFDRRLERLHVNAFRREVDYLRSRYRIVSLPDALASLDRGEDDPSSLVLTFDDGYAGVLQAAQPVLAEAGVSATVFVVTDERGEMPAGRLLHYEELEVAFRRTRVPDADFSWLGAAPAVFNTPGDRVRTLRAVKGALKLLPEQERARAHARVLDELATTGDAIRDAAREQRSLRKLTVEQCRELVAAGWTIGGHTRTHRSLSHLDSATLARELDGNARALAAFGFDDRPVAYPYGGDRHVDARVRAAARAAGFSSGWTTIPGDNGRETDRFELRRLSLPLMHSTDDLDFQTPLQTRQRSEMS